MPTQYVLQKLNVNKHRRFIANMLGEHGGTTQVLRNAKTWDSHAEALRFKTIHHLTEFDVVLSDGTDDHQEEVREYWAQKDKTK